MIALAPPIAVAQTPAPPLPESAQGQTTLLPSPGFARLVLGRTVVVTTSDGKQHEGVFTVSATGMIPRGQKSDLTVPFDRIVKV